VTHTIIKMDRFEGSTSDIPIVSVSLSGAPISEDIIGSSVTSVTSLRSLIIGVTSFVMVGMQLTCS
jgi:hypothetical protein